MYRDTNTCICLPWCHTTSLDFTCTSCITNTFYCIWPYKMRQKIDLVLVVARQILVIYSAVPCAVEIKWTQQNVSTTTMIINTNETTEGIPHKMIRQTSGFDSKPNFAWNRTIFPSLSITCSHAPPRLLCRLRRVPRQKMVRYCCSLESLVGLLV